MLLKAPAADTNEREREGERERDKDGRERREERREREAGVSETLTLSWALAIGYVAKNAFYWYFVGEALTREEQFCIAFQQTLRELHF